MALEQLPDGVMDAEKKAAGVVPLIQRFPLRTMQSMPLVYNGNQLENKSSEPDGCESVGQPNGLQSPSNQTSDLKLKH